MYPYFQKSIHSAEAYPDPIADFLTKNPAFGTLIFQVQGGQGAFPIANAAVTLTKELGEGQRLFFRITTDESGKTKPVSLPAPARSLSQKPGQGNVFAGYQAEISADGYLPVAIRDLPIFDGITTIQPVSLLADFGQKPVTEDVIVDKMPEL